MINKDAIEKEDSEFGAPLDGRLPESIEYGEIPISKEKEFRSSFTDRFKEALRFGETITKNKIS